jgi:hypothetical protein
MKMCSIILLSFLLSLNLYADQEAQPSIEGQGKGAKKVELPEIKLPKQVEELIKTQGNQDKEGTKKLGGSSTGGGNEISERFKTIGHVYAQYLEQITPQERQDLNVSATAEDIFQAINLFADDVVELSNEDTMSIYDKAGQPVAKIYKGQVLEDHSRKDAYLGYNQFGDQKIFVSQSWSTRETTVPLKEYLRAINKAQEIPAILNYARQFPTPDITTFKNWQLGGHRIPEKLVEKEVTIEKISPAFLTRNKSRELAEIHGAGNLYVGAFASAARDYLKAATRRAAFEYAQRMCGTSWDTEKYRTENYLYSRLVDFKMEDSRCSVDGGHLRCSTPWTVTCKYGYADELPKL